MHQPAIITHIITFRNTQFTAVLCCDQMITECGDMLLCLGASNIQVDTAAWWYQYALCHPGQNHPDIKLSWN